jgi:hypothetical protein
MSDPYIVAYQIITSLSVQLLVLIVPAVILLGLGIRFLRNPEKY